MHVTSLKIFFILPDEVQPLNWNNAQATIHPLVISKIKATAEAMLVTWLF
jgi:hypothetical protein